MILKGLCLICLYATIDPDWPGIRSQRGCWLGERVSIFFCFFFFFFDGYKQKSINIVKDWKDCKCVCVCVPYLMSQMDFIPQVFYRAELRLAGGDLPTSFLLPRSQQPQRDFWRLQRESQVWKSELWHWMRAKNVMAIIMETVEKSALGEWNRAELWWGLQKNYKGWVRGK